MKTASTYSCERALVRNVCRIEQREVCVRLQRESTDTCILHTLASKHTHTFTHWRMYGENNIVCKNKNEQRAKTTKNRL